MRDKKKKDEIEGKKNKRKEKEKEKEKRKRKRKRKRKSKLLVRGCLGIVLSLKTTHGSKSMCEGEGGQGEGKEEGKEEGERKMGEREVRKEGERRVRNGTRKEGGIWKGKKAKKRTHKNSQKTKNTKRWDPTFFEFNPKII